MKQTPLPVCRLMAVLIRRLTLMASCCTCMTALPAQAQQDDVAQAQQDDVAQEQQDDVYDVAYDFDADSTHLIVTGLNPNKYPIAAAVTAITIPEKIIYDREGQGVPHFVDSIAAGAFADATALDSVTLESTTPPALGAGAFAYIPQKARFTCPKAALEAYRNRPEWLPFFPFDYNILFRVENAHAIVTAPNTDHPDWLTGALTIPDSVYDAGRRYPVTAIADSAFSACTTLRSVTLRSATPPTLGQGAFANISESTLFTAPQASLSAYTAAPAWQPFFPPIYSVCFDIKGSQATATGLNPAFIFAETIPLTLTIPDTVYANAGRHYPVTAIADSAFAHCDTFRAVILLASPPALGKGAFADIPDTVRFTCLPADSAAYCADSLWQPYFHGEYDFTFRVNRGDSAVITGMRAGSGTKSSAVLTIPSVVYVPGSSHPYYVDSIAKKAFKDKTFLTTLTLPASLTCIEDSAFFGCTSLTSVTSFAPVPPSLGVDVFARIPLTVAFAAPLAAFPLYEKHPDWRYLFFTAAPLYDILFRIEGDSAIVTGLNTTAPNYAATGQAIIPDAVEVRFLGRFPVKAIDSFAFAGRSSLREVVVPSTVTAIGRNAFTGCSSLSRVELNPLVPPAYGDNAFVAISASAVFTCPDEVLDDYRLDPAWSLHFSPPDALIPVVSVTTGQVSASETNIRKIEGQVRLYNLRGVLLYSGPASGIPTYLPSATYFLVTPTASVKVYF